MSDLLRQAVPADAARLAELARVLGYEVDPHEARRRVEALDAAPDHVLLVAERDGRVVGFAHALELDGFVSARRALLAALVVDPAARRSGVARRLVEHVRRWAIERGRECLVVRSRVARTDAHAFYERIGFERVKTQVVFEARLDA